MEENSKMKIPGIGNDREAAHIILHPSGVWVALTQYNHEITGHTDNAADFPKLGEHIHYGGNSYYVLGEAIKRGWEVIDLRRNV